MYTSNKIYDEQQWHGTTILSVRKNNEVVLQVMAKLH